MSISTKRGDAGKTDLIGGTRVSKAELRIEACGAVDELNSMMGFARSICADQEVRELTKSIQHELFALNGTIANPLSNRKDPPDVTREMVEALTGHVHRIERMEGILADWSLPGEHSAAAAFDVARTVCRRAERQTVRMVEAGEDLCEYAVAYLNRLSDLLWLLGRLVELRAGVDSSLRDDAHRGPRWSRVW